MSTRTFGAILLMIGAIIFLVSLTNPFESMSNKLDSITPPPNPDSEWNKSYNSNLVTGSSLLKSLQSVCILMGIILIIIGAIAIKYAHIYP